MRIPYPERFQWKYVITFITALFIGQMLTGTNVYFALLASVYILIYSGAFNAAGGMQYPSGSFIFFTGLLVCIFGLVYKVFTGEPGESYLMAPVTTMLVYCGGMASMWLAAIINRKVRPHRGLLAKVASGDKLFSAAVGCLVAGFLLQFAFGGENSSTGSLGSAFRQLNRFPALAILFATTFEVKKSNGQRSFNWVVWVGVASQFALGVIFTSKEGMFIGPFTWFIAAWAGGYDFKRKNVLFGGMFMWFMLYYMIPYSGYVRAFRDKNGDQHANQVTALQYIFRLDEVRKLNQEVVLADDYTLGPHFYASNQGFADRLSMIAYDDALIARTDDGYVFGLYPVWHGIINIIPHFLWKDKPDFFTGNAFGHELGVLGDEDFSTGISFSPAGDAYHEAKWFGVLVVWPIVIFAFFIINDSLLGSVRQSPWPLLIVAISSHLAPEALLDGTILQATEGSISFLFAAYVIRYVFPAVMRVITRGDKNAVRQTIEFRLGSQPLNRPSTLPKL